MLIYAFIFLVIALIAAALGFPGVAGVAYGAARIFFVIFLVLFIALLAVSILSPNMRVITP